MLTGRFRIGGIICWFTLNWPMAMDQGILLSVSLLGLSNSRALSISAINSCWLTRRTRLCLLCPSAVVSPNCLLEHPKGRKTEVHKIKAKTTLHTKSERLFIIFPLLEIQPPCFLAKAKTGVVIRPSLFIGQPNPLLFWSAKTHYWLYVYYNSRKDDCQYKSH